MKQLKLIFCSEFYLHPNRETDFLALGDGLYWGNMRFSFSSDHLLDLWMYNVWRIKKKAPPPWLLLFCVVDESKCVFEFLIVGGVHVVLIKMTFLKHFVTLNTGVCGCLQAAVASRRAVPPRACCSASHRQEPGRHFALQRMERKGCMLLQQPGCVAMATKSEQCLAQPPLTHHPHIS